MVAHVHLMYICEVVLGDGGGGGDGCVRVCMHVCACRVCMCVCLCVCACSPVCVHGARELTSKENGDKEDKLTWESPH